MNTPNKLTIFRIGLVPFFVLFMLCTDITYSSVWALLIFTLASFTDYLDGKIARARNLVTNFGKFLDPIADKILVLSGMICMMQSALCNPIVIIIVLAREFLISSLRLVAASQNIVIAAGKSGKLKTASQMVSIVAVLTLQCANQLFDMEIPVSIISNSLMWITAAITVYSGAEYIIKNRQVLNLK